MVTLFLTVIILAFMCIGNSIWNEYRNSAVQNQKDQMLLAVESISGRLEETIDEYAADIRSLWNCSHSLDENEQEALWDTYVEEHGPVVQDVIIKKKGETILTAGTDDEPEEILSESRIDSQMCFRLVKIGNKNHYLMLYYETDTGETISMILNGMAYYNRTMRPLNVGTNGYFVLKDHNGIVLMHPQAEQWGIDVIHGREKMFPGKNLTSLNTMIDRQKQGLTAVDEYYSYWWTKPGAPGVEKVSAYTPAYIGKDFIIVSAVMDQSDMYVPLEEGALKLLLVFTGVLFTILAAASYIFHLMLKSRKDRQQITYLTELNGILEQMHQSEETIAHQQRLQIMGTMTGGIAHESNNLLTPIMGYAEFLLMDLPEDSDNYDSAKEIYEASVKAKEIIQQISSLSRKNMETAFKTLDVNRVIKRALKMVRSVCPDNIELKENIELPGVTIVGNETQLNQVILNIGVNAIHAIGHETGEIEVSAILLDKKDMDPDLHIGNENAWDQYIRIDIRDTGCGMSPDVLKQIFDPFFTTKKGGKGTGLGLALTEQIVTSHRGVVNAESTPGVGSVFHLYFPASASNEKSSHEPSVQDSLDFTRKNLPEQSGEKISLLIVDDNPKVLRLLERNFSKRDIQVTCVMDFKEAAEKLKSYRYEALVIEQVIDGNSAVDFCMSVKGRYTGMLRLIMADQVDRELAEAKERNIIDNYMIKPVSDLDILKELKKKQRIQDTATPSSRLTSALKRFEETASLTEDLKMHFGNNTEKTLDRMDPALPTRAAALLLQAQHVYIFAPDASCGLASIFCYRARRLGIQPVLLEGGSAIYEYMINITNHDLVLIFSFSRLLRETRILLDPCQKINCPVILFTDLFSTQEGSPSRLTFSCYRGEPNDYHSMTVPLLLLDLIILTLLQASKNSISSSHYLEELRAESAKYIGRTS